MKLELPLLHTSRAWTPSTVWSSFFLISPHSSSGAWCLPSVWLFPAVLPAWGTAEHCLWKLAERNKSIHGKQVVENESVIISEHFPSLPIPLKSWWTFLAEWYDHWSITYLFLNCFCVIDEECCFSILILKKSFNQCRQTTEQSPASLLSEIAKNFCLLCFELLTQELIANTGKRFCIRT